MAYSVCNTPAFTRALAAITRFGDELSIHGTPKGLKLSTISPARSAFALFTFEPAFFSKYRITAKARTKHEPGAVQLQLLGKTLHDIFRQNASASANRITLSIPAQDFARAEALNEDEQSVRVGSIECRLTVTIFCPHGIRKTHKLTYSAEECMIALADKNACTSTWVAPPRIVKDWTDHFMLGKHGCDEITFWCKPDRCSIKSHDSANEVDLESASVKEKLSKKAISTTLSITIDQFEEYNLGEEALLTVQLKELKAIVDFAMSSGNPMNVFFTRGGDPLLVFLDMDNLAIEFVLSTNGDDPANIKKDPQEDVKPRMTQSRLGSVLNNPRTSTPALAGAAPPAPRASSTPGPSMSRAKNGNEKVPLFQPEEEDDDHSAIQGEKGASADDDDEMWAEMDNEDPAFSQVALELTQSQSTRAADHQNGRPSTHDAEMTMSPEPDRKRARTASTALPSQGLQGSTQENAISLDDEESGDNEEDVKPMSSLPKPSGKKGKKSWQLGITD